MSEVEDGKYTVTVTAVPKDRLVRYTCPHCECDEVESKWYCRWDFRAQKWAPHEECEEFWCPNCQDETSIEEGTVGAT